MVSNNLKCNLLKKTQQKNIEKIEKTQIKIASRIWNSLFYS